MDARYKTTVPTAPIGGGMDVKTELHLLSYRRIRANRVDRFDYSFVALQASHIQFQNQFDMFARFQT